MSESPDRFEHEAVALFDRVREQLGPLPTAPVEQVVTRGRQVRRARRALTGAGVLGLAAAVAVPLAITVPGGSSHVDVVPAQTSTTTPAPSASPSTTPSGASLPEGMLRLSDLGSTGRWTVGTMAGDSGPVSTASWPGCTGPAGQVAVVQVTGTGTSQLYRGQTPEGAEWIANETLLHLDAATAQKLAATAGRTAGCTSLVGTQKLLATSPQVVVLGSTVKEGSVGMATAVAVSGTTLVSIDTLPGGAAGGVGLPGQTQWLVDLVRTAVQRAGAPEPAAPQLTQAALDAAKKYAPTSIASPSPTAAPAGFLTAADLGSDRPWRLQNRDQRQHEAALQVPRCQGEPLTLTGQLQGTGWEISGNPSGVGSWSLDELQLVMSPDEARRAASAVRALSDCPAFTVTFGTQSATIPRQATSPPVFGQRRADGGITSLNGWAISGNTLVRLNTAVGGDPRTPSALPVGVDWFTHLLDVATQRAAGH